MKVLTEVTEEALRSLLVDTLDKSGSRCGVALAFNDGGRLPKLVVGVPYEITDEPGDRKLVVGPYLKNIVTHRPDDFDITKKRIPIRDIVLCVRLEIKDLLGRYSAI